MVKWSVSTLPSGFIIKSMQSHTGRISLRSYYFTETYPTTNEICNPRQSSPLFGPSFAYLENETIWTTKLPLISDNLMLSVH